MSLVFLNMIKNYDGSSAYLILHMLWPDDNLNHHVKGPTKRATLIACVERCDWNIEFIQYKYKNNSI